MDTSCLSGTRDARRGSSKSECQRQRLERAADADQLRSAGCCRATATSVVADFAQTVSASPLPLRPYPVSLSSRKTPQQISYHDYPPSPSCTLSSSFIFWTGCEDRRRYMLPLAQLLRPEPHTGCRTAVAFCFPANMKLTLTKTMMNDVLGDTDMRQQTAVSKAFLSPLKIQLSIIFMEIWLLAGRITNAVHWAACRKTNCISVTPA